MRALRPQQRRMTSRCGEGPPRARADEAAAHLAGGRILSAIGRARAGVFSRARREVYAAAAPARGRARARGMYPPPPHVYITTGGLR